VYYIFFIFALVMCRTVLHDLSVLAVHDNAKSIADQWKLLYILEESGRV